MSRSPDFGEARDFYTFAPETLAADLPEFELGREVGKGSMGIVFEARVRATGARVALKVLPPSLTLTERALARFLREGQIMQRVRHPDIVGYVDQGRGGRLYWFAMEFVDGVTLEERLQVGPLPVQKACAIAARVARALQFAHDRGIVHRDIKPGNLMLRDGDMRRDGDGDVAITDFGLARETGTGSMTESGAIVGTPMYMAPEMVLGGSTAASTLADVYSLGATLYALVTGQPPFDEPTAQAVLKAVLERDPPPASRLRRDLPQPVAAMLDKAMARAPAERYGSALEFAEDLERFLRGERVLARRRGPVGRTLRWCARRPLITALGLLVVALAAGALYLEQQRQHDAARRELAEAESLLALAATDLDDHDRRRTPAERRDLLLQAVAAATRTLSRDEQLLAAWFVRARAQHRLQHYDEAIRDLDTAERRRGGATPELLLFRIDALRQLGDPEAQRRLQQDLTTLLQLDPSSHNRALVAEQLLDLAEHSAGLARRSALARAGEVLGPVAATDPRAAVARARCLELDGDIPAALATMRRVLADHDGSLYVHLQAAAMFDRHDLPEEGAREHAAAERLQPANAQPAESARVDLDGLGRFLGDVDRVLRALGSEPAAAPGAGDSPR